MRFLFITLVLLLALFGACQQTSTPDNTSSVQPPDISINENNGLQAVVKHYGGQGHFFKNTIPATPHSELKHLFEIELSNSTFAEEQKHLLDFTTSNMAYLFYKELNAEERQKYNEIHSVVILSDGQKTTTKFPTDDLNTVLMKMQVLEKVVELLKRKDYAALSEMINSDALMSFDKEAFIKNLRAADTDYGDIQSFQPFGFRRKKTTDGERILHLSGYLIRSNNNNEFSIDLPMDEEGDEVYLLQYLL